MVSYISELRHVCLFLGEIMCSLSIPLCINSSLSHCITVAAYEFMSSSGIRMTSLIE